jgi:hypothetical protein
VFVGMGILLGFTLGVPVSLAYEFPLSAEGPAREEVQA